MFEWEKKNRDALPPNAEGVRPGAVGDEDRAPKARGVSMQPWCDDTLTPLMPGM